jgi:hypothetical protein
MGRFLLTTPGEYEILVSRVEGDTKTLPENNSPTRIVANGQREGERNIMERKFAKIIKLMESKGGRVEVTDPDLKDILGDALYRVASYIWDIKHYAGLDVKAIRAGRKVVAYELVATASAPVADNSAAPVTDGTAAADVTA